MRYKTKLHKRTNREKYFNLQKKTEGFLLGIKLVDN